jgi:tetratricopeptide (TPR) repeat protein
MSDTAEQRPCPKCGRPSSADVTCPHCGVVFAKLRQPGARARPAPPEPPPQAPERRWRPTGLDIALAVIALVVAVGVFAHRIGRPPAAPPAEIARPLTIPPLAAASPAPRESAPSANPRSVPGPMAAANTPPSLSGLLSADDGRRAQRLVGLLNANQPLSASEVQDAEALHARYPQDASLRALLEQILMRWALRLRAARDEPRALGALQRAIALNPQSVSPRLLLVDILIARQDWPAAEAAARALAQIDPRNSSALESLGLALMHLGRDREAAEALARAVALGGSSQARELLARLEEGRVNEGSMKEQRLVDFSLRYDGEAHEDIGREILRALERHFVTLSTTFDHRPSAPIPVILFTRAGYYQATQAPRWSGGLFDNVDGRIRLPVGGLTTALTPDLDAVLVHELTHAFVADMTRNNAPRELHEGLAQYIQGDRLDTLLSPDDLQRFLSGDVGGVQGFYLHSLALAEYMMEQRGQSSMNDLLRRLAGGVGIDQACTQVYGQGLAELQQSAMARMRQRYGG